MSEIKYGVLHCHTEQSMRDSVLSVETLVKRAKELGAPAIALTDHGVMSGCIDFIKACNEQEINPIVGVEAYVEEESEGQKHLILMAKDYQGFQALMKAVSESNTRIVKKGNRSFPRMNKKILEKYFGPERFGHGHVIATSACVSGVLAAILLTNKSRLEQLKTRQKTLSAEISQLKKVSNRSFVSLERQASNHKAEDDKQRFVKEQYEQALADREKAMKKLEEKKQEKRQVDDEYKKLNAMGKQSEKDMGKWLKKEKEIEQMELDDVNCERLKEILEREALWYQELFGKENFYNRASIPWNGSRKADYDKTI